MYVRTYTYIRTLRICRYVQSWIDKREVQSEKANLTILFDRYVPPCLETLKHRFKKITPVSEQSMIQALCYLLEVLLTPQNTPPDCPKEWYELYFVFAAVWAFGGSMYEDQVRAACTCVYIRMYCMCVCMHLCVVISSLDVCIAVQTQLWQQSSIRCTVCCKFCG